MLFLLLLDLVNAINQVGGTYMDKSSRKPTHPGVVLLEDVIKPLDLSITKSAQLLGVSRKVLSNFVKGKSSLSADMALRISIATGTSAESWMKMQQKYSLWCAKQDAPTNIVLLSLNRTTS